MSLIFRSFCSRYRPDSQAHSPALRLFFQAWMKPLKPLTWVWWWGWPAGDQSRWWEAPGRPNTTFTLLGGAQLGRKGIMGGMGGNGFCQLSCKKKVGQFPADSSSLQAEQVTETLWSDSDLIKCYQTHISACTQVSSCFNYDRVAVKMLYMWSVADFN